MLIELIVAACVAGFVCLVDLSSFTLDEDTEKLLYYEGADEFEEQEGVFEDAGEFAESDVQEAAQEFINEVCEEVDGG